MNVLVTGSHGLIGSALIPALETGGHPVRRLVRSAPAGESEFRWDPDAGRLDPAALEELGAVVHLSGETVAGRWTSSKKKRILESRAAQLSQRRIDDPALGDAAEIPRHAVSGTVDGATVIFGCGV